jgi:hypothetical protein
VTVILGLLVLALLLVAVVAAIGILVPMRWLGLPTRGRSALIAGGAIAALVAIALIAPARKGSARSAEAAPRGLALPSAAAPPPGVAPSAAAATPDPLDSLRSRLVRDVSSHKVTVEQPGDGARVAVRFDLSEQATEGLTKYAAIRDLVRIMRAADDSAVNFNSLFVVGTATLVDVYGRESRDQVLRAGYERTTLRKINWTNFVDENALTIADTIELAPPFK